MNDDHLPRQLIPVRLAHLESPHSYLRRVCVANSIDPAWMTKMVGHRRQQRGTGAAELGSVIEELSGVSPIVFERAHSHARLGHATTRGTWDRQESSRVACTACTAGTRVVTDPHIRFHVCRRHKRWLGDVQRSVEFTPTLRRAEWHLRRLVHVRSIDYVAWATAVELVSNFAGIAAETYRSPQLPQSTTYSTADSTARQIALFPESVSVARAIAQLATSPPVTHAYFDSSSARMILSHRFAWAGPESWLLVEGATKFLEDQHRRRAA